VSTARRDQFLNPIAKPLLAELRRAGCRRGGWAYQATAISRLNGSERMASRWRVRQTKDDPKAVLQFLPARASGSRYLNRGTVRAAMAARGSCFERLRSTAVIGAQMTSIVCPPALTLLHLAAAGPTGKEARGRAVAPGRPVGDVVAMPIRSFANPGVFFEPDVIGPMSEALEAACKVLRDAGRHETVREIIARRIIAAASIGERDPVRLCAAALAGHQAKLVEASDCLTLAENSLRGQVAVLRRPRCDSR
jgi:hypothetical protein